MAMTNMNTILSPRIDNGDDKYEYNSVTKD